MRSRRPLHAFVLLAPTILAMVGCTEEGSPSAEPNPPTSAVSTAAPNTTETSQPGGDLFAHIVICDLVDQVLAGEGFPPAEKNEIVRGRNGCGSEKEGLGAVDVTLYSDDRYDKISGDPAKQFRGEVKGRAAILIKDRLGTGVTCELSMEVKPHGNATVTVTRGDVDQACEYATKVAERVEPLLPGR